MATLGLKSSRRRKHIATMKKEWLPYGYKWKHVTPVYRWINARTKFVFDRHLIY